MEQWACSGTSGGSKAHNTSTQCQRGGNGFHAWSLWCDSAGGQTHDPRDWEDSEWMNLFHLSSQWTGWFSSSKSVILVISGNIVVVRHHQGAASGWCFCVVKIWVSDSESEMIQQSVFLWMRHLIHLQETLVSDHVEGKHLYFSCWMPKSGTFRWTSENAESKSKFQSFSSLQHMEIVNTDE